MILLIACDQHFAGKFALNSGAKHVVCVKNSQGDLIKKANNAFIEAFYDNLVKGKTVCDSFNDAVRDIGIAMLNELQQTQVKDLYKLYTAE